MKIEFTTEVSELSESFVDDQGLPTLVDDKEVIKQCRQTMRRERQEEKSRRLLMIAFGMLLTIGVLLAGGAL